MHLPFATSYILYIFCLLTSSVVALQSISGILRRQTRLPCVSFTNCEDYVAFLSTVSTLPRGFLVGATRFQFISEVTGKMLPMNLTLISTEKPTRSFAALFTSNEFPGGPIIVGRDRLKNSEYLQTVVINNKISNVCPSGVTDRGSGDSEHLCSAVATELKLASSSYVFPSSTGIIGWRLPISAMTKEIGTAVGSLQSRSILPAALGITTTDRYPKLRSYTSKSKNWSVVGIAKGAGMIEPNMATMLAYIVTDLNLGKEVLDASLRAAVKTSFNTISVDGDQSTSDTVLALSSELVPPESGDEAEFKAALEHVCRRLAEDIVRNGEGTQHVLKISVTGAPDDIFARDLGRFVANSNLVKCAISGNDPNVGRIAGAAGSFLGKFPNGASIAKTLSITLGNIEIFKNGAFMLDPEKEKLLSDYMLDAQLFPAELPEHDRNYPPHEKTVDMVIELSAGSGCAVVIGSDLTKEYVEVNADYRS